jgi:hypothetical protein
MITEDYVSFEIAKLLKEKGFKNSNGMLLGKSGRHYNKYETFPSKDMAIEASIDCEEKCPLVTLQIAMKWLREVHNLFIEIMVGDYDGRRIWYDFDVINIGKKDIPIVPIYDTVELETYEEACEAAIKYCLENLI